MVEKPDTLYLRAGMSGNLDKWHKVIIKPDFISKYNFESYNYRINGVTYYQDCPTFRTEMSKLIFWAKVST